MKTNHVLAILAVIGGIAAAFTSFSEKNELYPTWKFESEKSKGAKISYISAPHLADMLYRKDQGIVLLDARAEKEYINYHIPSALLYEYEKPDIGGKKLDYMVYGLEDEAEAKAYIKDLPGKVYVLKGGLDAWHKLVLFPDFVQYKVRNREALEHIIRRSRYFGGSPRNMQLLHIDQRQSTFREGC